MMPGDCSGVSQYRSRCLLQVVFLPFFLDVSTHVCPLPHAPGRRVAGLFLLCAGVNAQAAGFLEDSSAKVEARNVYFNRDFRDGHSSSSQGASKREEWAQGFILNVQSGFTQGPVGVGVDAIGLFGVKLDSSPADSNSGLLPSSGHDPRHSADQYAKMGLAAKVKVSNTVFKYGSMMPDMPLIKYNDGRLLPTLFHGALLTSEEIHDLKFTLARLNKYTARDSTDRQDIRVHCKNKRYACDIEADHFDLAGLDYRFSDRVSAQYQVAKLENIYRQHFLGLVASQPLAVGSLSADLRLIKSDDIGNARAGAIDHRAFSGMLGYSLGATRSVPAGSACTVTAPCRTWMAATLIWSTTPRSTTSPPPRNVPGNCVMTMTSKRWVSPA